MICESQKIRRRLSAARRLPYLVCQALVHLSLRMFRLTPYTATRQRRGWVCAHISSRGSDYSEELGGACLQVIITQQALEQWSWGELKGKSGYLYGKANIRGSGASD